MYLLMGIFSFMDNVQRNLLWESIFDTKGGEGMLKNRAFYPLFLTLQPLQGFSFFVSILLSLLQAENA